MFGALLFPILLRIEILCSELWCSALVEIGKLGAFRPLCRQPRTVNTGPFCSRSRIPAQQLRQPLANGFLQRLRLPQRRPVPETDKK